MTFEDHYTGLEEVYRTLGTVETEDLEEPALCVGNHDFTGWYKSREYRARPFALSRDYKDIRERLERVLYASISYSPEGFYLDAWKPFEWGDNGREWDGEKPTAGYGNITAYAPFADIDLTDSIKKRRPDGDIPRDVVEKTLEAYIDGFADLAGGREHVYALDSVGGAYVMVSPAATVPIAREFDGEARKLVFQDLVDRLNSWLRKVRDEVTDEIPQSAGAFEPDMLNNVNRLYKAPLSSHKTIDGVVTPIDIDAPKYEFTSVGECDTALIERAKEWAASFTNARHREAVGAIVETLYPDHYAGDWKAALTERVAAIEAQAEKRRREAQIETGEVPDDLENTRNIDVIKRAVEDIDVRKVAQKVARQWDTAPGRTPPRFEPSWRDSGSGTSCFADKDKFVDLGEGGAGGGALKLAALGGNIITDPTESLEGEDYWKAINQLRQMNFDIPYFIGRDGRHPDGLKLFEPADTPEERRKKAIRAAKARSFN